MFKYKLLDHKNFDEILLLQSEVVHDLDNNDCFRPSTREMLEKFLATGRIMGAIKNNQLIAYFIIYYPNEDIENLGLDLKFNSEDITKVIHFETAIVHPDFRRNSLPVALSDEILKHIDTEDKIICATCHPLNYPSLSTLIKLGLSVKMLKMKYNEKLRFILTNKKFQITNSEIISCKINDFKKIESLLQDGYIGIKIKKSTNSRIFNIFFQKDS